MGSFLKKILEPSEQDAFDHLTWMEKPSRIKIFEGLSSGEGSEGQGYSRRFPQCGHFPHPALLQNLGLFFIGNIKSVLGWSSTLGCRFVLELGALPCPGECSVLCFRALQLQGSQELPFGKCGTHPLKYREITRILFRAAQRKSDRRFSVLVAVRCSRSNFPLPDGR